MAVDPKTLQITFPILHLCGSSLPVSPLLTMGQLALAALFISCLVPSLSVTIPADNPNLVLPM